MGAKPNRRPPARQSPPKFRRGWHRDAPERILFGRSRTIRKPSLNQSTPMPTRHSSAVWEGTLREGKGTYSGESGTLGGKYSFGTRFGDEKGSNPEELLAAAEAACFSMALSGALERNGTPSTRVETAAACTVEKQEIGFTVTTMKLTVRVTAPGITNEAFQAIAAATKDGCPISRAIKGNVALEIDAALV